MNDPHYTEANHENPVEDYLPHFEDIDPETAFKSTKYMRAVSDDTNPREKRRVLDKEFDEECEKLGVLIEWRSEEDKKSYEKDI